MHAHAAACTDLAWQNESTCTCKCNAEEMYHTYPMYNIMHLRFCRAGACKLWHVQQRSIKRLCSTSICTVVEWSSCCIAQNDCWMKPTWSRQSTQWQVRNVHYVSATDTRRAFRYQQSKLVCWLACPMHSANIANSCHWIAIFFACSDCFDPRQQMYLVSVN